MYLYRSPYNTGSAFEEYDDGVEHSIWLSLLKERLVLLRKLLTVDGSIWISIDDNEMAYLKVLLDEVFGRSNFVATMIWEKRKTRENRRFSHLSMISYWFMLKNKPDFDSSRNPLPLTDDIRTRYKIPTMIREAIGSQYRHLPKQGMEQKVSSIHLLLHQVER